MERHKRRTEQTLYEIQRRKGPPGRSSPVSSSEDVRRSCDKSPSPPNKQGRKKKMMIMIKVLFVILSSSFFFSSVYLFVQILSQYPTSKWHKSLIRGTFELPSILLFPPRQHTTTVYYDDDHFEIKIPRSITWNRTTGSIQSYGLEVIGGGGDIIEAAKKPLLLLHIGPHKTGTTSFQYSFAQNYESLKRDNWIFLGKVNKGKEGHFPHLNERGFDPIRSLLQGCIRHPEDPKKPCERTYGYKLTRQHLTRLSNQGYNVLVSAEDFLGLPDTDYVWLRLKKLFSERFRVVVVMTYRRYDEWIYSYYTQMFMSVYWNGATRDWPDNNNITSSSKSVYIPSFEEYYRDPLVYMGINGNENGSKSNSFFCSKRLHPVECKMRFIQQFFPDFVLYNFHDDSDNLLEPFYCKLLPNATETCSKHEGRRDPVKHVTDNSIDYQRIADAAHKAGLLKNFENKRWNLLNLLYLFHQTKMNCEELPYVCPDEEFLEILLNRTLDMEQRLFPSIYDTSLGEEALRSNFDAAVNNGKFCSVDALSVINDERWRTMFLSLKSDLFRHRLKVVCEPHKRLGIPKKLKYTVKAFNITGSRNSRPSVHSRLEV